MGARVGGPIGLIVIGLILALAISDRFSGVNLVMIGWILAGAGVVWLLLELLANGRRSSRTREVTTVQGSDPSRDSVVDREIRHDG